MKKCCVCKQLKDISDFPKNRARYDGVNTRCKPCHNQYTKELRIKNPEYGRAYRLKNKVQIKERIRVWLINNKEHHRVQTSSYHNIWALKKRKGDINYLIKERIRCRTVNALQGRVKADSTEKLLGCSIGQLRQHLQVQLTTGMSWENYGKWHIDHIRPCSSFDFSKPEDQRQCFHYTNLQPLWASDNLIKSDKWNPQEDIYSAI